MKKRLSIILCIVLTFSMLFTMTGCGSEEDKLTGTWKGNIDYTDVMNELFPMAIGEELASYFVFEDLEMSLIFEFDDGIMTMSVDEDSADDLVNNIMDACVDGVEKLYQDIIDSYGYDMTVDELLESQGTSMDELVEQMNTDDMVEEITSMAVKCKYEVKEGKILLSEDEDSEVSEDNYMKYTVSDDELKITDISGTDEIDALKELLPLELEKK